MKGSQNLDGHGPADLGVWDALRDGPAASCRWLDDCDGMIAIQVLQSIRHLQFVERHISEASFI